MYTCLSSSYCFHILQCVDGKITTVTSGIRNIIIFYIVPYYRGSDVHLYDINFDVMFVFNFISFFLKITVKVIEVLFVQFFLQDVTFCIWNFF